MKTRPTTIRIAVPEAPSPLEIAGYSPKKYDVSSKKTIHAPPATDTATATNVQRYQAPAFSPTGRCSDHCASKGMAGFDRGVVKVWQNVFLINL